MTCWQKHSTDVINGVDTGSVCEVDLYQAITTQNVPGYPRYFCHLAGSTYTFSLPTSASQYITSDGIAQQ